jgi:hypothetical protein
MLAVCAAAVIPYVTTIDDYFIRDDFGVVQLLAGKPAGYFPAWFYTSWMENIWGYLPDEVRPFPAVSYQLTALGGAASPAAHHLLNIALHAANGLLVFATALLVLRLRLWCAALAGVIFVLLPSQAESVAWITGRVDSMPAFFYISSFLCHARWRERGGRLLYAASLGLFFIALFTKQTTITMVATLVAYDLLVAGGLGSPGVRELGSSGVRELGSSGVRELGSSGVRELEARGWATPLARRAAWYAPYVALTLGYLALRLALFGEVVRESQLNARGLGLFFTLADRHLTRVVLGDPDGSRVLMWLLIALVVAACVFVARSDRRRDFGALLFFGPVWWILGVAPVAVAGYESPRHVYLASMAWAMLIAFAFDGLDRSRRPRASAITRVVAGAVVAAYAVLLVGVVRDWNTLALVSLRAAQQLARDARVAPPGTLIVVGVPGQSWEWVLPVAARPPFASGDLTKRVFIISPRELHCCRQQWFEDTRRTLEAWAAGPASGSVAVLRVDERAAAGHLSSSEQPSLPEIARTLSDVRDPDLLDQAIRRLLDSVSVGR